MCALSAPLNNSTSDQGSPNIQKIPSATNGQLSRPSPINPSIPSEPKPEEHITYITPSPSVGVNENASGSDDDILHPPALNAYEKVSSSDPLHKLNKRDTQSVKPIVVTTPTPVIGTKPLVPITLGQPTIAEPPAGYKHEKRSATDEVTQSSQFETSHHIPAHIQQASKQDIGNPATSVSESHGSSDGADSSDKKPKRELAKDTKLPTATSAIISESTGTGPDEVKKTKLPIPLVGPVSSPVTDEHHQNKREDVEAAAVTPAAVNNLKLARVSLTSTNKLGQPEPAVSESAAPKKRDAQDKPQEVENDDHEPAYVHPVPVSQIIKNSQVAPEIHT